MFRPNSSEKWELLFATHRGLIRSIARKWLGVSAIEDIEQTVAVKLYKARDRIDFSMSPAVLKGYVATATRNACVNALRSRSAKKETLFSDLSTDLHHEERILRKPNQVADRAGHYSTEEMRAAINRLSKGYREIAMLSLEGKTYPEISEALGITRNAVKGRMHVMRRRLLQELKEMDAKRARS